MKSRLNYNDFVATLMDNQITTVNDIVGLHSAVNVDYQISYTGISTTMSFPSTSYMSYYSNYLDVEIFGKTDILTERKKKIENLYK